MTPRPLPTLRSDAYLEAVGRLHLCTLGISSFLPGHHCSAPSTTAACHLHGWPRGQGVSTAMSDHAVACACGNCRALIDLQDGRWVYLAENYAAAVLDRMLAGLIETQALMMAEGRIVFPSGEAESAARSMKEPADG